MNKIKVIILFIKINNIKIIIKYKYTKWKIS